MLGSSICRAVSLRTTRSFLLEKNVNHVVPCIYRNFSSHTEPIRKSYLEKKYDEARKACSGKKLPTDVDTNRVFACNELDLSTIKVYGFDYDYTLANYTKEIEVLLFDLGLKKLVNEYKYPPGMLTGLKYNPDFAIIGLHYDIENSLLMKLDHYQQIQSGSVYRGKVKITDEEVKELYPTGCVPLSYVESHLSGSKKARMLHIADCFTLPEVCLLAATVQYFRKHNISYQDVAIYDDVKAAIGSVHPTMHTAVMNNVSTYLNKEQKLEIFFDNLKQHNKEIFLITNSPFNFVNAGMTHLLGETWRDYFDIVIADAKKPAFFGKDARPFREYDTVNQVKSMAPIKKLNKESIYVEGSLKILAESKQWTSDSVLYFGDHPYSDLADLSIHHGWRTAAIIWELEHEIQCLNCEEYKTQSGWLMMLQSLLEECQGKMGEDGVEVLHKWRAERNSIRSWTKELFNKQFGSVFRTHSNPTYFSRRLFRFADIYTSKLTNLNNYSLEHKFYARRGVLPHDYRSPFV